ncbi:NlpC/P60 family protein [Streptomonospora salina]|uniref:NlpC/P60 domain-containing protein n=1 Tax=Streptomonospora salina TaxID=104205 RepID=A0A841EGR2_9ACTN|nr:NlpC/P60 family protein [Streptomonospora salina]MBB6000213.1 hypothetical protein [Streptomonospora salina]
MAEGIGAAFLTVRPDLSGFGREVVRKLAPALSGAEETAEKSGARFGSRFGRGADRAITASLRGIARSADRILVSSLGASGAAVAGALAPASGALLALPAAAGIAGAAISTVAVGLRGMGDAMTAVAEGDAAALNTALEELSPNARTFVRSWQGVAEQFAPVQKAVQDGLFAGLDEQVSALADNGMPTLQRGMTEVADSINDLAVEAGEAASTPLFRQQTADIFSGTADAATSFEGAVTPLTTTVAELVKLGLPLVERLGEWTGGALTSAAAFLSSEQGAAQMSAALNGSLSLLGQLGSIGANLGRLLGGIFGAASSDGQTLLDTIESLTGQWATWAQSAQGQEQIGRVFGLLTQISSDLLAILPDIAGVVGTVATGFSALPAPVQSVVTSSLAWMVVLGPLLGRVRSLAPAATLASKSIGLVAKGASGTVGALARMGQGFRSAAVAQSAFSGRAGTLGGILRSGWNGAASATRSGAAAVSRAARSGLAATTSLTRRAASSLGGALTSGWQRASAATRTGASTLSSAAQTGLARLRSGAVAAAGAVRRAGTAALSTTAAWTRLAAAQTAAAAAAVRTRVATVATAIAQRTAAIASRVWAVAQWALNAAMSANPLGLIVVAIGAVIAAVVLAYKRFTWFRNLVQAAFRAIAAVGLWLWDTVLSPFFAWIGRFVRTQVGPVFSWLNAKIVQPALRAIGAVITWLWKNVGRPIFGLYVRYLKNVVAPVFTWLWRKVIGPAMRGVGSVVSDVWDNWVSPAFSALKAGVSRVADSFKSGVAALKRHWKGIKSATKQPVKWVVDVVYTDGIKKMWDSVAGKVGLDKLPAAPKFATGGIIPGYNPGHDSVMAMLSPGEAVLRPEATRWLGADAISDINLMARRGRLPAFADGGVVGSISSSVSGFLGQAKDLWTDGIRASAKTVLDPMVEGAKRVLGDTEWGRMIATIPANLVDKLLDWFGNADGRLGGGPIARKAIKLARSQIGVPYSWGGGGPAGPSFGFAQGSGIKGFDCSSLMQYALVNAGLSGVPRVSQAQMGWTKRVGSPRPGDLGFPHPGHVLMATEKGGDRIIEAPYTGAHVRERSNSRSMQKWGRPSYNTALGDGGIVTRPLHALVGEAGPEAVIPLGRGLDELGRRIANAGNLPERAAQTQSAPAQPITVHARTDADPHAIAAAIQRRTTLLRNAAIVPPAAPVGAR